MAAKKTKKTLTDKQKKDVAAKLKLRVKSGVRAGNTKRKGG